MTIINFAESDKRIADCFPVMVQLRSHLAENGFVDLVKKQQTYGYRLVFIEDDGVKAVAGFRISQCFSWGKFLYVEDLVTDDTSRSKGYGDKLFNWLVDYANQQNCDQFHLDSGILRFATHRFYFKKRMVIKAYHFMIDLHEKN